MPMPGHPVSKVEVEKTKGDIDALTELIKAHDVVYLLTDSRESRWLPTLLCAYYQKVSMNY
jgi:ubiquitin-like modifier-activating enzyme ATG7